MTLKKILAALILFHSVVFSNVITIDATKNSFNGYNMFSTWFEDTIKFKVTSTDAITLLPMHLREQNLGLYYSYTGEGFVVDDSAIGVYYKYDKNYKLRRVYDTWTHDSIGFAKKENSGFCLTLGSPDVVWNNSLQFPQTTISSDTFQSGGMVSNRHYFRGRPLFERAVYNPPPPEPGVDKTYSLPENNNELNVIQYLSYNKGRTKRNIKIQAVQNTPSNNCFFLRWATDGAGGNGVFAPDNIQLTPVSYLPVNKNQSLNRPYVTRVVIASQNQVAPAENFTWISLLGRQLSGVQTEMKTSSLQAHGCYINLRKK
jgi:hypothetical protein